MIPHSLSGIAPNREHWLTAMAVLLRPWFLQAGYEIPLRVRLGVGSLGESRRTLGACFNALDQAGFRHITISPFIDDPLMVGGVLVHELIHVILPAEEGHGRLFRDAAGKLGLEGRMTTASPGPALRERLQVIVRQIGPFPHRALSLSQ